MDLAVIPLPASQLPAKSSVKVWVCGEPGANFMPPPE